MKDFIKVLDHDNLYRDPSTGAIINIDKRPEKSGINNLKKIQSDVEELKHELYEIKKLLTNLLQCR